MAADFSKNKSATVAPLETHCFDNYPVICRVILGSTIDCIPLLAIYIVSLDTKIASPQGGHFKPFRTWFFQDLHLKAIVYSFQMLEATKTRVVYCNVLKVS